MKYLLILIVLTGCTATNPNWTKPAPGQPDTNTSPQFVPDPRINAASNYIIMGAKTVAPFNPYDVLTSPVIAGVLALWGTLATYKANQKNKALGVMGEAVVKSGAGQAVIAHSTNTDHFAEIANAVNNATGANQDNVGTPKS
jgi:hypothetical protein